MTDIFLLSTFLAINKNVHRNSSMSDLYNEFRDLVVIGWTVTSYEASSNSIRAMMFTFFFSSRFVRVHVVHPYSSIDATAAWYGCTTWTLTKRLEKRLDGNYTRMLRAILNKSWRQHPTRHQLYGHLPPITKTIHVRRTRHVGHCWRSRDELISDVLLWTLTHGRTKAGRPARTYIQQLCEDTGFSPEDLPEAMKDREKWRERVRDIRATSTTWWWWCSLSD